MVEDTLLVHHPAEDHGFIRRAAEEIVQQVADVIQHHRFGFLRHLERIRIPAPIAIEEHAVWEHALERLANRRLPHAHRPADEIQLFHVCLANSSKYAACITHFYLRTASTHARCSVVSP